MTHAPGAMPCTLACGAPSTVTSSTMLPAEVDVVCVP
jgi:hypothetical protein